MWHQSYVDTFDEPTRIHTVYQVYTKFKISSEVICETISQSMIYSNCLSTVNTPDVTSRLHKALQYFSDAAETYSKVRTLQEQAVLCTGT